jgi:hypothetical protein
MRRGIAVLGIVLSVALAGCGGGGGPSTRTVRTHSPHPEIGRLRAEMRPIMNRRLARFGASKAQIACVDRVIAAGSAKELVRRVEQGNAVHPIGPGKTPKQAAGALAGDCF